MTFRICLAHHIQAILVAEVIEVLIIRIVRGTDCVQVPFLHQLDVFLISFLRHIFAAKWVGIVAVGAAEQQRLSIDGDRLIFRCDAVVVLIYLRTGELDLAEAELLGNAFEQLAGIFVVEVEDQRVEVRVLGAPKFRALDQLADICGSRLASGNRAEIDAHRVVCKDVVALGIKQLNVDCKIGDILCRIVGHDRTQLQICIGVGLVQVGDDAVVRDMHQGGGIQVDVAEDTAVVDHILVFHPRSVAEFMYLYCKGVDFALRVQIIGDVELVRTIAVLTIADLMAVDIHIISGLHALEGNQHAAVVLKHGGFHSEFLAVETHRVVIRRRLRNAGVVPFLPRHLGVRINGIVPIAAVLIAGPAARNIHIVPPIFGLHLIIGVHKAVIQVFLTLFRVGYHDKLPIFFAGTAEHLDICGLILCIIHGTGHCLVHRFIRNSRRCSRLSIDSNNIPSILFRTVEAGIGRACPLLVGKFLVFGLHFGSGPRKLRPLCVAVPRISRVISRSKCRLNANTDGHDRRKKQGNQPFRFHAHLSPS